MASPRAIDQSESLYQHDNKANGLATNGYSFGVKEVQTCSETDSQRQPESLLTSTEDMESVDMLNSEDLNQVLAWNADVPNEVSRCLHHLIEEQAARRKDDLAICSWDGDMTYTELDNLSSKLAYKLIEFHVGPEIVVPLCFEKSKLVVVCMLAVMKAGGAIVFIDRESTAARTELILAEVQSSVVLTSPSYAHMFHGKVQHTLIISEAYLKDLPHVNRPWFSENSRVQPHNAVSVVFTSGSTGTPKGVISTHASRATNAYPCGKALTLDEGSRVLQFASYSFDTSIGDIVTTLLFGGVTCIPSEEERLNDLPGAIRRMAVNQACLTSSVVQLLDPETLPTLRKLAVGGEPLAPDILTKWATHVHLTNIYGSTECDWAMANPSVTLEHPAANIGYALGARAWLVSPADHDSLVAVGTIGELLIEGPILAREYLNDPLLTKQKFLRGPRWAPTSGNRFYKTGDLAQYAKDGSILYVGRKDTMVKVHGQRIELSAIEHAMVSLLPDGMQVAAETVHFAGRTDEPVLAAFVALGEPFDSSYEFPSLSPLTKARFTEIADSIERGLRQVLPAYMIPAVYLPLRELPVNNSFKRDRKRLRQLVSSISIESVQFASQDERAQQNPSTPMEVLLSQLWSALLNIAVEKIWANSSFFRLGGDSLTAIRLASRLRSIGLSLPVVEIMRYFRLSDMAQRLAGSKPAERLVDCNPKAFELIGDVDLINSVRRTAAAECQVDGSFIQDAYPCSPLQAGIMSLSIKDPGSYVSREVIRLPRDINIQKLQTSWMKVVQTYDILRTRIIQTEELGFVQVVLQETLNWSIAESVDLYLDIDRKAHISCGDRLTRYCLIEESQHQGNLYLVWTIHHALYDAWSLDLIIEAVEREYEGLDLRYSPSFNCFIEHNLSNFNPESSKNFWKSYLHGATNVSFPSYSARSPEVCADSSMTQNILVPRREGLDFTLSTVLHAAWGMVIASYASVNDIVFGVTVSGRNINIPNVDCIVGPLITTVPVRIQFNDEDLLRDTLDRIYEDALAMVPFEHTGLQNIQQISAETKAACGFQTIMVIQPETGRHAEKARYHNERVSGDISEFNNYCILLECSLTAGRVVVTCSYDSKIIDHDQMNRVMQQFDHFVQQLLISSPKKTMKDIGLLNHYDQKDIISWNKPNLTAWTCIHDLINQQVRCTPHATALHSSDGGSMSYQRLDQLSSLLSRHLEAGRGNLVPLCFEKGFMVIVAMLAVLKSGAGFVLLDASHPTNRLLTIIQDTHAKLIIASESNVERFEALSLKTIMASEASLEALSVVSNSDDLASPKYTVQPNDIAYAIYTSGSTGKPKGVLIEHASFSSGSLTHTKALNLNSTSRALQFASFSYGAALIEMISTLIVGGCVCIPREEDRFSNLAGTINSLGVNWALLTPSVVNLIDRASVPSLRTLVVGGEALSQSILEKWGPYVRLIHAYGQSECSTVGLAMHMEEKTSHSTIGYGLGAATWIVKSSDHNHLVPIGAIGELLIEGPIVSTRGYLGDEKKTAAAFIADPVWSKVSSSGRRFYKTGDLVRYKKDGSICYVGRKEIDEQVKINGQRIELGDIEHHLASDEMIKHAVVIFMKSWKASQPSLVAVVSLQILPGSESDLNSMSDGDSGIKLIDKRWHRIARAALSTMRESLADALPLHMIPSTWIIVEKVPLTPSGKLDRKRTKEWLANLSEEKRQSIQKMLRHESEEEHNVKPPLYDDICEIWSLVLKIPLDGIRSNDSFITLGGDSITAMQVIARCRCQGISVTVKDLLGSRNLSQLCQKATKLDLIVASPVHEEQFGVPFALSPIQQVQFSMTPHGHNHFNLSFFLHINRVVLKDVMSAALDQLVRRHSMLRARFTYDNQSCKWTQTIMLPETRSHTYQDYRMSHLNEVEPIMASIQQGFDIGNGPLVGFATVNIGEEIYLFATAHHLVVDLVSWRIILQDLEQVLQTGSLPLEKPLSFQTWCRAQEEYARTLAIEQTLPVSFAEADFGFWDMETSPNLYEAELKASFKLSSQSTASLLGNCNRSLRTEPIDVLLGAAMFSFCATFPERDLPTFWNEGHGREGWDVSIDPSSTVGWFTTVSPIPMTLDDSESLISCVRKVKDMRFRIPGKGWPYFTKRVLSSADTTDLNRFEILFNYAGIYQQLEQEDGLFQFVNGYDSSLSNDEASDLPRFALFQIYITIESGVLNVELTYNRLSKFQERIRAWVHQFEVTLENAITELSRSSSRLTLSDFPLMKMDYGNLDYLADVILPRLAHHDVTGIEDIYPCTAMQEALVVGQSRISTLYHLKRILILRSSLETSALSVVRLGAAWQEIVDRHPILRTVVVDSLGESSAFSQIVFREMKAQVEYKNAPDIGAAIAMLKSRAYQDAGRNRPPHLFTICSTMAGETVCSIDINHVISDGHSLSLMVHELGLAYYGRLPLEPAPKYRQYIEYLQESSKDPSGLQYWLKYLSGVEPCLVPPSQQIEESNPALDTISICLENIQQLRSLCQVNQVTTFNLIQLVWGLVLATYLDSQDVCFGYLAAGRDLDLPGLQDAVGPYINMLICRIQVKQDSTALELLKHLHIELTESLAHQTCSLGEIQHNLTSDGRAIFNTAISLQKVEMDNDNQSGLLCETVCDKDSTEYDMTLNILESDADIKITLDYSSNISSVRAMGITQTFTKILESIRAKPETPIRDLSFCSAEEESQLVSWNNAILSGNIDDCIHKLFAINASRTPNAPAVCSFDGDLSYHDLDSQSSRLAHRLVSFNVGPEVIVPLYFEKSKLAIIAILAVLKAGGAFVLLETSHPAGRLKAIIEETGAKIALASSSTKHKITELVNNVIAVDEEELENLPASCPDSMVGPENASYLIFTSGSTGKPKGCVIEHATFCTSAIHHTQAMSMNEGARVLNFASYSFDAVLVEILSTLLIGGCVCIPSETERSNSIASAITRMNVDCAVLTPTVASFLEPSEVPCLRTLILAGESLSQTHLNMWADDVVLVQAYGPSECAVASTATGRLTRSSPVRNIGKPIMPGCWVCDSHNHDRLVPLGAIGELLIEGNLAREYLGDRALTDRAFIRNPKWAKSTGDIQSSRRFYKTGDLVYQDFDGSFVFVARKDTQVKLHGQRIETGEVIHQIKQCLPIDGDMVAAIVTLANAIDPVLAVFLAVHNTVNGVASDVHNLQLGENEQTMSSIRTAVLNLDKRLLDVLPTYMVPSIFILVPSIPVQPSGKTDYKRIRELAGTLSLESESVLRYSSLLTKKREPSTFMEAQLQRIWSTVLGLEDTSVGVDDNFFRLGADSISAMRAVAAAQKDGILFTVADVFQNPTLDALALVATSSKSNVNTNNIIKPFSLLGDDVSVDQLISTIPDHMISTDDIEDIYPCTSLQEGLMALSMKDPGSYVNQEVFKLPGDVDIDQFKVAWERTTSLHDILRTTIIQTDMGQNSFLQVVFKARPGRLPWAQENSLANTTPQKFQMICGRRLTQNIFVCDPDSGEKYFVFTIHHALYDARSLNMIYDSVQRAYHAATLPKVVNFKNYIRYISQIGHVDTQAFWRSYLADADPSSFPEGRRALEGAQSQKSVQHRVVLPADTTSNFTTTSFIRAAWALLISRYTGNRDVVFGATLDGRSGDLHDIASVAGPTISTVPLRYIVDPRATVAEFLAKVQDQAAKMIKFAHFGLQNIQTMDQQAEIACQFQNLLVIQPSNQLALTSGLFAIPMPGLDLSTIATYPLSLECQLTKTGVELTASFDTGILSSSAVSRMLQQFDHILQQLYSHSDGIYKIGEVRATSVYDEQLIGGWNAHLPAPLDVPVHDLIYRHTNSQPHSEAICAWDGSLTYQQLDDVSTKLAYQLIDLGIVKGSVVPICSERSMWVAVAVLGVMKAGGTFVLMDASVPMARLNAIHEKVKATLVIASRACACYWLEVNHYVLDGSLLSSETRAPTMQLPTIHPDDILYIIFTSGSTGHPKGAIISHSAYGTGAVEHERAMNIGRQSRVYQFASYSFGASIAEILSTLIVGGCVCIPSDSDRIGNITSAIGSMRANLAIFTPSFASILNPSQLESLETVVFAGEALLPTVVDAWIDHVELIHGYGQSEASVCCSSNTSISRSASDHKNIGRAFSSRIWIGDIHDDTMLAPVGAVGEMFVEGPILSRGYIDNALGTDLAFVERPALWVQEQSVGPARMYKTGDLGRYNDDGTISYIGRKQGSFVKIRGQRVEIGEVEHHIRTHLGPESRFHAMVEMIEQKTPPKESILAAFIGFNGSTTGDDALKLASSEERQLIEPKLRELHDSLLSSLPSYMIPSQFITLERLPLTATGKQDRQRLRKFAPKLYAEKLELGDIPKLSNPQTLIPTASEIRMREIWSKVLQREPESIELIDNFFSLGGNSLSAVSLVTMARTHGMSITVQEIFKNPSLRQLAKAAGSVGGSEAVTIPAFSLVGGSAERESVLEDAVSQCEGVTYHSQIEDIFPCTPLQEGMFSLSQTQPGTYVAQEVLKLPDLLDLARFRQAWERTVQALPVLRTRIIHTDHGSMQVIMQSFSISWNEVDNLELYVQADKDNVMQPGQPLVRYAISMDSEGNNYFIWTIHHALYDGWTLPMILGTVKKAYSHDMIAFDSGCSMSSFVKYLSGVDTVASEKYWMDTLSGFKQQSFPSPSCTPRADETLDFHIKLDGGMPTKFTSSTIIRASWALLLSCYSLSDDVVFGTVVTGRNAPVQHIESLAGPTMATVPIRVQLDYGNMVDQLLNNIQEQTTEMIPFEQAGIQHIRKLSADTELACNFQSILVVQPKQVDLYEHIFGTSIASYAADTFNPYALMVQVFLEDDGLLVNVSFDSSIIPPPQMRRILHQFDKCVRSICGHDGGLFVESLISNTVDDTQVRLWNSNIPDEVDALVHDLVSLKCTIQPENQAVSSWDGSLTYKELDHQSSRLASYFCGLDDVVGPKHIVALCMDKSKTAVICILALLKTGAGVLMLDPSHPPSRLLEVVTAASTPLVLCDPHYKNIFENHVKRTIGDIPLILTAPENIKKLQPGSRSPEVNSQDIAFVISTSGSTGTPKLIAHQHSSICSNIVSHSSVIHVNQETRALQFSSFAFDMAIYEIFTTLINGGCVCMPSEEVRLNDLSTFIQKSQANWAFWTPSFATSLDPDDCPSIKTIVTGGELLTTHMLEIWLGHTTVVNAYGPAEGAVCTAIDAYPGMDVKTIGSGVGCALWIVNPLHPSILAPVGAVGELIIQGPNIAREYLNDLDKTRFSFLNPESLPWLSGEGKILGSLFRTGDLVRYNEDGTTAFLARVDGQVKVRGQRVEVEEIEHTLRKKWPVGLDVAVENMAVEGPGTSGDVLTAFLCVEKPTESTPQPSPGSHPSTSCLAILDEIASSRFATLVSELRILLLQTLPSYMVPALYLPLMKMPMSSSQKKDRKLLKSLGVNFKRSELEKFARGTSGQSQMTPLTEKEKRLRDLWANVLKISVASIHAEDSWIKLGGDSILAMRLASKARADHLRLSVADVLRSSNLREMSALMIPVNTTEPSSHSTLAPSPSQQNKIDVLVKQYNLQDNGVEEILECTGFQADAITTAYFSGGYLNYLTFDLGAIEQDAVQLACQRLVDRLSVLRTVFTLHGGKILQIILRNEAYPFEFKRYQCDNRHAIEQHTMYLVKNDMKRPFPLAAPIVRFIFLDCGSNSRLIMRLSHAQYDGISLPLIYRFLIDALAPPSPLQHGLPFPEFIRGVTGQIQANAASAFWKSQLQNSSMTQLVRNDRPSYSNMQTGKLSRRIATISLNSDGITFASILKTAWALVLAQAFNTEDVVFGHLVSGRNLPLDGIEAVVGPCLNVVPIHINTSSTTVLQLLKQVQKQALDMIPFENFPFKKMVDECTDWPTWTRCSSVVQHQNLDESTNSVKMGDVECKVGAVCPAGDAADVWIVSTPGASNGGMTIEMAFCPETVPFAEELLDMLCDVTQTIRGHLNDPPSTVLSGSHVPSPRLVILPPSTTVPSSTLGLSPSSGDASRVTTIVEEAWSFVLGELMPQGKDRMQTPFYELRGVPLLVAVAFVERYSKMGFTLTVEDIMVHPSMKEQVLLLGQRGVTRA